jgi:tetratricopeptide (TPR) repeat protein
MRILREFRSGELRPTAQALLIQILPEEIDRLVKSERYPEALVLAKQNKEIFQKNWIDIAILGDLAYSYGQIGLYEHAKDVYLYLMEIVSTAEREQYYLPLIETVSTQGDSVLTANLAGRYLNTYPAGTDRNTILRLYLEALVIDGKFDEAQALLPEPLPADGALRTIAATLAFHQQDYPKTLELIDSLDREERHSSSEIRFMEAESLFRTGKPDAAGIIFLTLQNDAHHFEQVLYRLAQIELADGKTEEALKFYRQIVEKGKNSLWQRYAAKELEYLEATERLRRKME